MRTPLVSLVVQCYNTAPYVRECLDSILAQEGDIDWEVIAIDDASPDGTGDILERYASDRVKVIRNNPNRGPLETIDIAMAATTGKYVARIDSDDRYRPQFLNTAIPLMEQHAEVGVVYGDAALIGPDGAQFAETSDVAHGGQDYRGNEFLRLLEENIMCAPTVIARREAWISCIPIPREMVMADWYFNVNATRRFDSYYVHKVLADYRVHPGNWHTKIIKDGREERCIRSVLDRVYAGEETRPELESLKRRHRDRIFASNYCRLGDKYFGLGSRQDARRCYVTALKEHLPTALTPGVVRRLAATFLEPEQYEGLKRAVRLGRG